MTYDALPTPDLGIGQLLDHIRSVVAGTMHALLESALDAIVIVGNDGRIVLVNVQAERLFGYARAELIGQPIELLVPERYHGEHHGHRDTFFTDPSTRPMGAGLALHARHRNGREFPVEISLSSLQTQAGVLAMCAIHDITERTQAEARFRGLLESAPDAIVTVDESGRIVLVNSQTEQMFGYNRDELLGQQIEILMPERFHGAHHTHRTSFLSDPRTRSMGAELDLVARRQDGSEFPADISLSPLHPSSTADDLLVTAIIRDITERRRWEAERAQLAGERARRREAEQAIRQREEFLTIAAHELKTPLTSVKAAAQFLVRLLDSPSDTPPDLRRPAQQLTSQVARMESLVADLLDASRLQLGRLPMSPEPIDLIPLIQQVIDQFTSAAEQTPARRIVVDAPSSVTGAWDPARLDQVLTNLISNALKYSPAGGEVRITVRCHADEIDVSVADRGIGIAPEDQTGLFQPFARGSTPSRTVSGTGLGLYISNQIVRRHGGQMRVESQLGVGSTVSFHLPRQAPVDAMSPSQEP